MMCSDIISSYELKPCQNNYPRITTVFDSEGYKRFKEFNNITPIKKVLIDTFNKDKRL